MTPRAQGAAARRYETGAPAELNFLRDQGFFLCLPQLLDSAFEPLRKRSGADSPYEHELERRPASKIPCACAGAPYMLRDPSAHVRGDPCVESSVTTSHDIDRPLSHGYARAQRSAAWRNACPASGVTGEWVH